jgi:hypothetical protein
MIFDRMTSTGSQRRPQVFVGTEAIAERVTRVTSTIVMSQIAKMSKSDCSSEERTIR